jgi:hypothetical protein
MFLYFYTSIFSFLNILNFFFIRSQPLVESSFFLSVHLPKHFSFLYLYSLNPNPLPCASILLSFASILSLHCPYFYSISTLLLVDNLSPISFVFSLLHTMKQSFPINQPLVENNFFLPINVLEHFSFFCPLDF